MKCRFCQNILTHVFADLGTAPPTNSFLTHEQLGECEIHYPLKVYVCEKCFLVQIDEFKNSKEIFSDEYVYFSSVSKSWVEHARRYVELMRERLGLNENSFVIEIASNDGYLLQHVKAMGIPCLGIEPTRNTAEVAKSKGIPIIGEFFGTDLAKDLRNKGIQADLLIGNNVLAHVPNISDFVTGLKIVLKPSGTITMEFPYLMKLVEEKQFDTIYHEHFSYLSFGTVCNIFEVCGLDVYDVEELSTHGGSLRIYAKHYENKNIIHSKTVARMHDIERKHEMRKITYYDGFQKSIEEIKYNFLHFLLKCAWAKKTVAAYGAAAKGNTLLNYCGIKSDLIHFVCDRAESKQNKFLPGSRIPVLGEEELKKQKPDYVVIFPWNLRDEIQKQLNYIKEWNGKFVTVIPELKIS